MSANNQDNSVRFLVATPRTLSTTAQGDLTKDTPVTAMTLAGYRQRGRQPLLIKRSSLNKYTTLNRDAQKNTRTSALTLLRSLSNVPLRPIRLIMKH